MRALLITLTAWLLVSTGTSANAAPPAPHLTVGSDIKQLLFDWDDVAGATHYRLLQKVGSGPFRPLVHYIPASDTRVTLSVAVHQHSWSLLRYAIAACDSSGCTSSNTVFPRDQASDAIGYFKASNTETLPRYFDDGFGHHVILSNDGRSLAVSAPAERSNASGVNGNQLNNRSAWSGAVYLFRRVGDGWRQSAYIKAPVNRPDQAFGMNWAHASPPLAFNADGSLLAVGAPRQEVSGVIGAGAVYLYQRTPWLNRVILVATLTAPELRLAGNFGASVDLSLDGRTLKVDEVEPWNESLPRTHLYVRPDATWQHVATFSQEGTGRVCRVTRLSRDGNTLVSACEGDGFGGRMATRKRAGNSWVQVAEQTVSYQLGHSGLVLDHDGSTMALQEVDEQESYTVGVYKWTGSSWVRERQFTPRAQGFSGNLAFGQILALTRAGNLLAIANPGENDVGAVDLWRRDDVAGTWSLRATINAPEPGSGDLFGGALSMCGSGHALAIGSAGEDSNATGIDGDRTNNASDGAGAVYLY